MDFVKLHQAGWRAFVRNGLPWEGNNLRIEDGSDIARSKILKIDQRQLCFSTWTPAKLN